MQNQKSLGKPEAVALKEATPLYGVPPETAMVRTQIYLTRAEHEFVQSEAARRGVPMSRVIRNIIDEKMTIPEDAWTNNSILEPTVVDPDYEGHEDSSLNHDHYAYGAPKKYGKRDGKWVLLPELDE
jgi:hypothetical protein